MAGYRSYGRSYGRGGSYGYGGNSGYKSYSYGGSWDYWGSYFNDPLEDDSSLVVKEPENYTTPSTRDIESKANVWRSEAVNQIKELARVCYFKMIGDKNYLKPEYADFSKLSESQAEQMQVKKDLYDKIFDNFIPGFTPLEQAIAIYQNMSKHDPEYADDNDKSDMDLMKEARLDFDREVYFNPNINDQLELNEHSKNKKMSILNKVSLIGRLGEQFKVEKEVDEKIVSNSDTYSKKMMRDYAQLAQVDLYQRLFPNFPIKLLMKDLVVSVPVDRKEQKQKIIIILDYSGSMNDPFKQDWVNAILIDRFRYVMQGEAEVFFSYFVSEADEMCFQHVHDRASVVKFWQHFSNEPNGGMTRVGDMVERIASEVGQRRLMNLDIDLSEEKPEILVINDGQDSIHSSAFPYKVNAICLDEQNNQLKKLCIATHGKQVHVDSESNVRAYSESGEEVI
jgi:uncharacterized protein with von Willebrand factor type A (vWA) domain